MKLHGTMRIEDSQLYIGGVSVKTLAEVYGTPLYIFDEENLINRVKSFLHHFRSDKFSTAINYAAKAFSNVYVLGLMRELGLSIDVVSEGELYTAIKAGIPPDKINLHGNNKLLREIEMALDCRVGTIIMDHPTEFSLLSALCRERQQKIDVLLRLNPCIPATTHRYIQTAQEDSKFGMSIADSETYALIQEINADPYLNLKGVHAHIGSQILDRAFFFEEAEVMLSFIHDVKTSLNIDLSEVNLGGGFGVYYTADDQPFDLPLFLTDYIKTIEKLIDKYALDIDTVSIEPGRSLVNDSGSILYTVGSVKYPFQGRPYVFVDGGMTDNIRPVLYEASYEAGLANRMNDVPDDLYRVAGKCCESGDVLIQEITLPKPKPCDLLIIPAAGAYTYSMSSNYNRIPKPAVVFVNNGRSSLAVKREDCEDLIRNDLPYISL
ncbi:MAG: diaminopimelate decarboxylase [Clostridiaceae bacterium]|jgi:diaminopimelate decarboxylase|nr:diaminopimelate decarboxylase [Clostridiaceae bacterium]